MVEMVAVNDVQHDVRLTVNGTTAEFQVDPRSSLLDVLRGPLGLTGTKKGCDHGQCGSCTVHVDGRRVLSCLTLAAATTGAVTTVEGLAGADGSLHLVQAAFVEHDGVQCGFCTPGQVMSAVALLAEAAAGVPSQATPDVADPPRSSDLTDAEIRERMSGNICRCGAYPGILAAVRSCLPAGRRGTQLPAGSRGTQLPAGSRGTQLPAGSRGTQQGSDR